MNELLYFPASQEFSNKMGWVHPTSRNLYTTIGSLQSLNSKKAPPFRLSHVFSSFSLVRGAWRLACVRFYFQHKVSTQKPTHMMTCTYDFWRRHIYVKSPILSGSHILGPQGPIIYFPHNFTKIFFFRRSTCFWNFSIRYFQTANKKIVLDLKCVRID